MGVTESRGEEASNEVLRRADAELYTAKHDGRNRVSVSAPRRLTRSQANEDQALPHG